MHASRKIQLQLLAQNTIFAVLLAAAAVLGVYLLRDSKLQWDLTLNQRSTLSQATRDVLKKMDQPLTVTAYATTQDPALGDIRGAIRDFIAPYQRVKADISVKYVDPREQPKQTAAANVRSNGELVIEYGTRSENLATLNEQAMANLLIRLARSGERTIMYVDGHGEPKLEGGANFDLGSFGRQLGNKGFRLQGLNLGVAPEVPDNADVLVLTHPRVEMLKGEVDKIARFVDRGGSLFWLIEQEPLRGLQPLAERLELQLGPGVAVDPAAARLGIPPIIALSSNYGFHPITENFTQYNTAFPLARAIGTPPQGGKWRATVVAEVAQNGWVEAGNLEGDLRFDAQRDVRGPVPAVVALERQIENATQRVVVAGGASFLSNQYVGLLANLDLGTNILNWLAQDENLITIQPRERVDATLQLTRTQLIVIFVGFLIVLPLAFLIGGGWIWWRRRRA
jgi:ABC-type uncharacterized transport system involved in gliding motility auxiliary subunit